ncbi:MAG: outer membrane protein assembly factor BamE [Confluentimicrobium sp.]|jgi:outer membrane protein assembly factor BamE (lipoprotein component of BamABCDE complex)|uniref:Outer membrane protein assembly factor BamE (Lipoprotein component of BamABCDE complex) n=1 Tax=Actibacterium naphthalenivorans TaxID=1614693 RepID=A0A840C951_9RHOB|nr:MULTISPECIES: outer membrane protein assembly factor BamE [Actibacterium]KGB82960.1 hypothetical protein JT55_04820 [Rhodovulum sp. NI22]MDY6859561.1 outer membrane protein assembly factor BamE [Pseudomonadota bacterium]ALG90092.1 hypothetical protein TQ29_07705 [Actibacterium sp. EMB200-NS6]MBB4021955.1 outer membrane protein assembly factor BamE (lipoprotein component of BamABCDE complex) [Actibacterium naphthalenivorans]MBC57893.1 outer membrane protein assembly factor BamE [Actibacteriu|tara:strand:+ start:3970 stop:4443 length:474 start_codon:yes stop_codon:yes gene_type:complete
MRKTGGIMKLAIVAGLALGLSACTPIYRNHGYAPSETELGEVVVGIDTRDTVQDVIGPPSASGVIREDAWYYVASRWQTRGMYAPEVLNRELVAISFDDAGTVRNIERYGLEHGRVVALNRRVTDDNIKGVSFIGQLLGNIGNVTADQLLGQGPNGN